MNLIDSEVLYYARDNECSEGVLQRAISVYADNYYHNKVLVSLGLFFVILTFVIFMLVNVFIGCRNCIQECLNKPKEPTKLEKKITSLKDKVSSMLKKKAS